MAVRQVAERSSYWWVLSNALFAEGNQQTENKRGHGGDQRDP
jgi:hypothetical protein